MKRLCLLALPLFIGLFAPASYGAKPTSFQYVEEIVMDDETVYALYLVKCSNEESFEISAFDNKKLWCEGKGIKENCEKKNIKLGKKLCK